jgi:hypothetical protein
VALIQTAKALTGLCSDNSELGMALILQHQLFSLMACFALNELIFPFF